MSTEIEIEIPVFIELKESNLFANDLGAFSRETVRANQFIGTYDGKIRNSLQSNEDLTYIWAILNSKQVPIFYIDATDAKDGNWLRFIRSTTDFKKQNIICLQQDNKINYYTIKEINPGEELTYYSSHSRMRKTKNMGYEVLVADSNDNLNENSNEESKDSFNNQNISDEDLEKPKSASKGKRTKNGKKSVQPSSESSSSTVIPPTGRVWTCQMCKKRFDQRVLLNRHDCIDLRLKIFKKKKELGKKKLKDLQWKRKIDLSYIETTNFTNLFRNIADNLSFCVDGTKQDLKSYSLEVKDYLNSMLFSKDYKQ
ncbi:MDS1 and EVI1 complex locus EVI1 isoform X2, partial [Brachionus plicatilis]